jgi:hypothetical protein
MTTTKATGMKPKPEGSSNDRSRWKGASLQERLSHIDQIWIDAKPHQAAIDAVSERVRFVEQSQKSEGLLVLCGSGGGKSALCAQLRRVFPTVETAEQTRHQTVIMNIPKRCTEASLASALLEGLKDPAFDQGHASNNRRRAIGLLKSTGVRVLAVDNFQDIPEHRTTAGVRKVGNWFRDLFDDTALVMVALGTEQAQEVRLANDQVRRRIAAKITVPYFSVKSDSDLRTWMYVLKSFDTRLPMAEDSKLQDPRLAALLYFASNGILGYLCKLLKSAIQHATARGAERIEAQDLKGAFDFVAGEVPEQGNPFEEGFKGRGLDRVDELFYRMERRLQDEAA